MNKSLFVIFTPYQLLSVLNTIADYDEKNAILLLVHKNLIQYISYCSKYNDITLIDFTELYDSSNVYSDNRARIQILKDLGRKQKLINKNKHIFEGIKNLYVPSDDIICRLIYKKTLKNNKEVSLRLIDDGLGTYIGHIDVKKSFMSKVFFTLFSTNKYFDKVEEVYCYCPELFNVCSKNLITKKITMNTNILALFDAMLEEKILIYEGKKVIFLDQGKNDPLAIECLDILSQYFGKEELIVKKHPRIDSKNNYDAFTISNDGIPAELVFSKLSMDDSLLIAVDSTATVNPYLLNHVKPFCVMLFDIWKNAGYEEYINTDIFIKNLNKKIGFNYFSCPESIQEFRNEIERLSPKLKGAKTRVQ